MSVVPQAPPASAGRRKGSPGATLGIALTLLLVALACAALGIAGALARSDAAFLVAVPGLAAYAFFTRWIQEVDRSRSRVLRLLERVRCYIAHEEVPPADGKAAGGEQR